MAGNHGQSAVLIVGAETVPTRALDIRETSNLLKNKLYKYIRQCLFLQRVKYKFDPGIDDYISEGL
jgi:hypothetical protein